MKAVSFVRATEASLYHRMGKVLASSGRAHGVDVDVRSLPPAYDRSFAFFLKACDWTSAAIQATEPFALLDCDLLICSPLDSVWQKGDFDIAVTRCHGGRTLNSGVIFVRPSDRVARFFNDWPEETARWCDKNVPGQKPRYSDQDALDSMLARTGLRVLDLPMVEWNSTQLTWRDGLHHARILHVKSGARAILEGINPAPNRYEHEIARLWRQEEQCLST